MKTLKMIRYQREQEKKLEKINNYLDLVNNFDNEYDRYYNPYTGFIQDEFLEDRQLVLTMETKTKEINDRLVELTNPLPIESKKWFWLESEGEKRLYWLWELKLKIEQRLRFAKYGSMANLDYYKRSITINQRQDPTSAMRYSVGKRYRGKNLSVNISEAYGCLMFHIGNHSYNYQIFEGVNKYGGRMTMKKAIEYTHNYKLWKSEYERKIWLLDYTKRILGDKLKNIKLWVVWRWEVHQMNKELSSYLKCKGFDIRHFEECVQATEDHYHGEMNNPYDFADPMGCLADYE